MSSPLFRKEAIENNTQRLLGDVLLIRPISFWIFTFAMVLLVAIVSLFLVFGKFARRETVAGFLVPDKGVVRVYAPFNGIIDQKHTIDGSKVTKGQNLLEVTTERGSKDSISINQQLIIRLETQKTNLTQRIDDEILVLDSEGNRLSVVLSNHKSEYYQITRQIKSQQEELKLLKEEWDKYIKLMKKGLISEDILNSKRNAYFNSKASLDATKRFRIQKKTEIANTEKQLEQSPLRKNNRLQELQHQYAQLEERLIELKNSRSYIIKAPVNGRVTSSQITIGQNVSPAVPILTIIPENTVMHAELFLPSRAIGFIKKNQEVLMRYDAFPYQRYGLYKGKIIQIAEAVISPNEVIIPIASQEPVYRIKVALDMQAINAYGKRMPLQSGMSVVADIILEERSLGQWLLEPIYSLKGKL
ncbi:HlyD family efflux transporter periplasmic adaptor subunit [Aquimarina sp. AD10]|uniref:HlyD family secretion protein n=1 Tax=Aquimarina sp. AD10 TaxID=1714849 RepID=UPI000E473D2A|nr:HlyD family efflux transporter periplasmic adaptor subunit [Aquimarina sp. AD10]AXT59349.1 HlyD family efflux transporter periplasmic adaptor subunit [Aquimarina sp. AD10]RKM91899.1 HlyD family efflux transporter periplasmic adaptor subunit [Aquimarina sp. AD10]